MSVVNLHPNYHCRRSVIKSVLTGGKQVQSDLHKDQEAQKEMCPGIKCNEISLKVYEFILIDFTN